MKKKIILRLVFVIFVLCLIVNIIISYNFRQNGIDSSIKTAKSLVEIIKSGLVSYTISNNLSQKDIYINTIKEIPEIENLKIIRSNSIIKEYGVDPKNEVANEMEKEVLSSGKMKYFIDEDFFTSKTTLKISIPFKAEPSNNCANCHKVQYGETLGAISLDMDISNIKNTGFGSILLISFITLIAIILGVLMTSNILNPYTRILQKISISIKYAINGKFVSIKKPKQISKDLEMFTDDFNTLIENYKETFDDIDHKLKSFIGYTSKIENLSAIEESKLITNSLSNLFQFKKDIEKDLTKNDIIKRLIKVIQTQFNQNNFTIFEVDNEKNTRKIMAQIGNPDFCSCITVTNLSPCKGLRTKKDTFTQNFRSGCSCFTNEKLFHFCTSMNINDKSRISINFVVEAQEEFDKLKEDIPFIKSYIQEATPSIKILDLLKELKDSAFKDGLTGLYNRKYLNEYVKIALPQTLRENKKLAILMLDIDHFKSINDKYGHNVGDIVLKQISSVLLENIRESDLLARFGGEEFIVILNNIENVQGATKVANKIKEQIEQYNIFIGEDEGSFKRTVSIGVAMFPDNGGTFEDVLKNADIALYKAKRNGRNQVVVFQENYYK